MIKNKVALVPGVSSGIGQETVQIFQAPYRSNLGREQIRAGGLQRNATLREIAEIEGKNIYKPDFVAAT